jgi:hypothetical protein
MFSTRQAPAASKQPTTPAPRVVWRRRIRTFLCSRRLRASAARLAAAGEPFFSCLKPNEIARLLGTLGFTTIEDRAAKNVIRTYLDESADCAHAIVS